MLKKPSEILKCFGFEPLTLDARTKISGYFKKENCNFSDYSFSLAYVWSPSNTVFFKEYNGSLFIVRVMRRMIDMLYPPLGAGSPENFKAVLTEAVSTLSRISKELGTPGSRILSISEEQVKLVAPLPGVSTAEDLPDYIYEHAKLIDLAGSKYKNKRENINKFLRTYSSYEIEPITAANIAGISSFLKNWYYDNKPKRTIHLSEIFDGRNINPEKNFVLEALQTRSYLKNFLALNGIGACIKLYGAVAGFIIGEQTTADTFTVAIEKVDNNFFGLSQFLFREFLKENVSCEYVNTSDDSGMPGLQNLKQSYMPAFMKKRFYAAIND
ncbi:MAG TPA: phosphatidylglycerol lysyltransferase domain-containing protein [Candidatus Wallbacteria bacterium]|nr:phosphatidylglycerol lysyltransferase domain-containing protein [Candidatus Wallbacteria bacterium]